MNHFHKVHRCLAKIYRIVQANIIYHNSQWREKIGSYFSYLLTAQTVLGFVGHTKVAHFFSNCELFSKEYAIFNSL